jgi:hypothetical protein
MQFPKFSRFWRGNLWSIVFTVGEVAFSIYRNVRRSRDENDHYC